MKLFHVRINAKTHHTVPFTSEDEARALAKLWDRGGRPSDVVPCSSEKCPHWSEKQRRVS